MLCILLSVLLTILKVSRIIFMRFRKFHLHEEDGQKIFSRPIKKISLRLIMFVYLPIEI